MAKKIKLPKVKSKKMGLLDKLYMGIAGLAPFSKHPNLYRSLSGGSELGARRLAKLKAARIAKYGKLGARGVGGVSALLNPWTAIPMAGTYLAQHLVGNALEPYKNQDVENTGFFFDNRGISAAGNERLLQERLAREELAAANRAKREGTWLGKLDERMLNQLSSAGMNEGGIARLL